MFRLITLLLALHTAFAQFVVQFDTTSYSAGDTMKISWSESTQNVLILKDQDVAQVLLCTCNSTAALHCSNVKSDIPVSQKSISVSIASIADIGPSGYYMIQLATHNSKKPSQYALAYSNGWAKIDGLTGTGLASQQGCSVPSDSDNGVPGTASSIIIQWTSYSLPQSLQTVSGFDVPYTWQKGATRTAPFQRTPGTKVTQTVTPSRRYPTSSYSPFTTYVKNKYMPITTATPGPSSKAVQQENFASTIATTPSGRKPTRIMPTLSIAPSGDSKGHRNRRRRWAD